MTYQAPAKFKSTASRMAAALVLAAAAVLPGLTHPGKAAAAGSSPPAYRYTKSFDASNGQAYGYATATDAAGNVYVVGAFAGTIIFDGTGGTDSRTDAGGNEDAFLTKYNANGSYAWTRTFDTSPGGTAFAQGVATDTQGDVYVVGGIYGTVNFAGTGGSDNQSDASGNGNVFISRFSSSGAYGATHTFDDTAASGIYAQAVATDAAGDAYFTGTYTGTVVFDGTGGSHTGVSGSNSDTFVTKFNHDGSYGYTKTFDVTNGSTQGKGLAVDSSGNVYVASNFSGTVIFDGAGGADSQTDAGGSSDSALTKYSPSGAYIYTKSFDTSAGGYAGPSGLAADPSGNIYETGGFGGGVTFDGPGGSDTVNSGGGTVYLLKYRPNGTIAYADTFDTSNGYAQSVGVAVDPLGDAYLLSGFNGTVVFDGPGGADTQTVSNNDGAITKYDADGSYAWTRIFDSSNGFAVLAQGAQGGIATDALGNVFATSFFSNTITFDGPGGTDTQTTGTSAFLTSYQAFTPAAAAASAAVPQLTNTGFDLPLVTVTASLLLGTGLITKTRKTSSRRY